MSSDPLTARPSQSFRDPPQGSSDSPTQQGVTLVTFLVLFGTAMYHDVPLCTSAYHDLFDLRVLVVAVRTTEV